MIKKLFILPLLGVLSIGAFASADSFSCSDYRPEGQYLGKIAIYSNSELDSSTLSDYNSCLVSNYLNTTVCNSNPANITTSDFPLCSSILDSGSSDPEEEESSSGLITIPSSFASGLTSLVNNFGSTIVGRLPTILLVALGITAIFALFRVVRNYAKSAFKG